MYRPRIARGWRSPAGWTLVVPLSAGVLLLCRSGTKVPRNISFGVVGAGSDDV